MTYIREHILHFLRILWALAIAFWGLALAFLAGSAITPKSETHANICFVISGVLFIVVFLTILLRKPKDD